MLILVTGLTPTFGSPGEYKLDSTFEMGWIPWDCLEKYERWLR